MHAHFEYVLRLADNALILGQRLSEWCGHAPVLEEDLALANMALDLIGQARALLTHAGGVEGRRRDEDQLAFLRAPHEYRNVVMTELPNGDFAVTVVRNLLLSAFNVALWRRLLASQDPVLREIAARSAKEARFHLDHATAWTVRLGDGTATSHQRAQAALEGLWPYTGELFEIDAVEERACAAGIGAPLDALRADWLACVMPVLATARLRTPPDSGVATRGKAGIHTEHIAALLDDMQFLQRRIPGATW